MAIVVRFILSYPQRRQSSRKRLKIVSLSICVVAEIREYNATNCEGVETFIANRLGTERGATIRLETSCALYRGGGGGGGDPNLRDLNFSGGSLKTYDRSRRRVAGAKVSRSCAKWHSSFPCIHRNCRARRGDFHFTILSPNPHKGRS